MPYMTAKLQFEVARRGRRAAGSRPGPALAADLGADFALGPRRPDAARPAHDRRGRRTSRAGRAKRTKPTVDAGTPTVWVRADDGLVRPVHVKLGLSDGMVTELTGGA